MNPDLFGHEPGDLQWRQPDRLTSASQIAAARLQHAVSFRVQLTVRRRSGATLLNLAEEIGSSRDRLGRMLRGELAMRVEDLFALATWGDWDLTFGPRAPRG